MRAAARMLVLITVVAVAQNALPLHAAPIEPCSTQGASPPPVTIGHFGEGAAEVGEFCRYLVRQRIWPRFLDLGSVRDPETARRVNAALEAGTIDVIWLNASAMAMLAAGTSGVFKIAAVTDLPVINIVSRDPNVRSVIDPSFERFELMVTEGASAFYADALLLALGQPARCGPRIGCTVGSGEEIGGRYVTFLNDRPSRAVLIATPTLPPSQRNGILTVLLRRPIAAHLVEIPPQIVARMQGVPGTMMTVLIPIERYGPGIPATLVPSAAGPVILVSGTPAEVEARVRQFIIRLNEALLRPGTQGGQPRMSLADVQRSLDLLRTLGENLRDRLILHEEYARILPRFGLSTGPVPASPTPTAPPTHVTPTPVTPTVTTPPRPAAVILEFTARISETPAARLVTLSWRILNARRAWITANLVPIIELRPEQVASGSRTIPFPQRTTIYTLNAEGLDGRVVSRIAIVTVTPPRTATPVPTKPTPSPTPPSIR